jgi:Domain of unknown function (DUF4124)
MNVRLTVSLLTAGALFSTWNTAATAAEIYRWVGDDGVVHYSDRKPQDDSFTTIEYVDTTPADYDPLEDPYSIVSQAKRLNDAWIQLARAREAKEQQRREEAQSMPQYVPYPVDAYTYDRGFSYYLPAYPGRPGYRRYPARQQAQALYTLDLAGPKPYSINSGEHQERVSRSALLPLVPATVPQPH